MFNDILDEFAILRHFVLDKIAAVDVKVDNVTRLVEQLMVKTNSLIPISGHSDEEDDQAKYVVFPIDNCINLDKLENLMENESLKIKMVNITDFL